MKVLDHAPINAEDFAAISVKIRARALELGDTKTSTKQIFEAGSFIIQCIDTMAACNALADRMEKQAYKLFREFMKSPIPAPAYIDNHLPFCKDAPRFKVVKLTDAKKEGILIESCEDTDAPIKKIARTSPVRMPETPIIDNWIDFAAFDKQYQVPSLCGHRGSWDVAL